MPIELFEGIVTVEAQYLRKLEQAFEASTYALKANHELVEENERLRRALNFIVNNGSSWGLESEEYVERARAALEGR